MIVGSPQNENLVCASETGDGSELFDFSQLSSCPAWMGNTAGNIRRKKKKCLKGEEVVKKPPLGQALSIHVLHPICAKRIGGGAKSKALADEELHLLWCPYLPLQPTLILASTL